MKARFFKLSLYLAYLENIFFILNPSIFCYLTKFLQLQNFFNIFYLSIFLVILSNMKFFKNYFFYSLS